MIKLSGMPDLTLSFINPRLLDDVSFHPCVQYKRWEVSTVHICMAQKIRDKYTVHAFGVRDEK